MTAAPSLPGLPGALGMTLVEATADRAVTALDVADRHLAATGFVHAACVVALADTACGYGALAALAPDAGFTTVSLTTHHIATAAVGQRLQAVATPVHLGRSTQVWDATVTRDDDTRPIAVFRCTQLVLAPAGPES